MKRRDVRRRKNWKYVGDPSDVFFFGMLWGFVAGMIIDRVLSNW